MELQGRGLSRCLARRLLPAITKGNDDGLGRQVMAAGRIRQMQMARERTAMLIFSMIGASCSGFVEAGKGRTK